MPESRSERRARNVLAGLGRFGDDQGLGAADALELIEAFCARGDVAWRSSTRGTYRSVLRQVSGSPGPGLAHAGAQAATSYSAQERSELWSMVSSQRTRSRRHSALALVALGLGAGLRPREIISARASDVRRRSGKVFVAVSGHDRRRVAVAPLNAAVLVELAKGVGEGFVFHPEPADRSYPNFINVFCHKLVRDPDAPLLCTRRLRSSFICDHLAHATRLSVLLEQAGIKEVESLLRYCRYVEGAPQSKAALRMKLAEQQR